MKTRKKISLLIIIGLATMITAFGCGRKIVGQTESVRVTINARLSIPTASMAVALAILEVSTTDSAVIAVDTLDLVEPDLVGEVTVPAGPQRLFTISVYDGSEVLIYGGSQTADVFPDSVIQLDIQLRPMVRMINISPRYQELYMNEDIILDVNVFNIPNLTSISFSMEHNYGPFYFSINDTGAVSPGTTLPEGSDTWVEYDGLYQTLMVGVYNWTSGTILTDAQGDANLAVIRFGSYADWGEDTATAHFLLSPGQIWVRNGEVTDTIPLNTVYPDNASVSLFRPMLSPSGESASSDAINKENALCIRRD